jgi:aspartate/methionine/tyrosine aminotransferase
MWSARTRWELAENRLSRAVAARRAAGAPVLDLTASNPTHAGLQAPAEVLALLGDAGAREYSPEPLGLPAAREAAAAEFARHGAIVDPARVFLSASTSEAYAWLFKLLCDPGDRVLVPRPSYPLFEYLARLESVEVDRYPLSFDGEWHLPASSVEAALTPRTRAVVVVHPNNPTGSCLKRDEAAALHELCAARGVAIVSDEVFADYAFGPDPRRAASFAADGQALAFAMGGLSKACALPQLKAAWTAVSGPAALREEALARIEVIADTYLSVATPVQRALPALLARREALAAPVRARIAANLATLREALRAAPAVSVLPVEAGWSAVLRMPATLSEDERALRLLEREGVLCHPGYFFDFESGAWLVVSLLAPPETLAAGAAAIARDGVL